MITLENHELIKLYENSNDEGKKLLTEKYGKEILTSDDWMKIWDNFCKENNFVSSDILPSFSGPKTPQQESTNAHAMLQEIVPIENKGWVADWAKGKYKYWPVWNMMESGFGCSGTDFADWAARADVGSRLCSETSSRCEEIAKKYLPIYKKWLNK